MRPRFPSRVTLRTPGPPQPDPATGNMRPGPTVVSTSVAYLSQRPVANISQATEQLAQQDTVTSLYTLLVPPGTAITARSRVVDEDGAYYEVEGDPAVRRDLNGRTSYIAAALRRLSDLQDVA